MDFQESFFDTGELKLRVMEGPRAGPPLVLAHGATGNWKSWMSVLPALTGHWHVYALELRGHGLSDRARSVEGYHLSQFASDILAFLRRGVENPPILMGHSWGAMTALLCAGVEKNCLRAAVLVDPPLMLRRENTESKPFTEFFAGLRAMKQAGLGQTEIMAVMSQQMPDLPADSLGAFSQAAFQVDVQFLNAMLDGFDPVQGIDFATVCESVARPTLLMQANLAKGGALPQQDADFAMAHTKGMQRVRFDCGHDIMDEQTGAFLASFESFAGELK